jgi:hypothetical protein
MLARYSVGRAVKDVCRLDAWFEVASSVVTGLKVLEQRCIGAEISGVANIREDERCVAQNGILGADEGSGCPPDDAPGCRHHDLSEAASAR